MLDADSGALMLELINNIAISRANYTLAKVEPGKERLKIAPSYGKENRENLFGQK